MPYQVEKYDGRWNEIREEEGHLVYFVDRKNRQIHRIKDGYVSGPAYIFLEQNVIGQFKEDESIEVCA